MNYNKFIDSLLCKIGLHKWEWYLPNDKGTIIGTQWCPKCKKVVRGVRVKQTPPGRDDE